MNRYNTISLIIATYNGERYIEKQLDSIIKQTIMPDEIIAIDDCSSDNTVNILRDKLSAYGCPYQLIVHKDNLGVNKTFEEAIRAASSDYVMMCDQDDVWYPDKIEVTKKALEKRGDITLAVCDALITDSSLQKSGSTMFEYIRLPLRFDGKYKALKSDSALRLLLRRNYVTGMCMAVKRDVALESVPISDNMVYDTWIAWNAALKGSIIFIGRPLALYRQHDNNVIGTKKNRESLKEYYSHRRRDKYSFVLKYRDFNDAVPETLPVKAEVRLCYDFYTNRYKIGSRGVFQAGIWILANVLNGNYRKYTPSVLKESMKDILEVIFFGITLKGNWHTI